MRKEQLFEQIRKKSSFLCIGLDADIRRIPRHLLKEKDPLYAFNKQIIDATADLCVAYKPNVAFYESLGSAGWDALHKTAEYMPKGILRIADAKRGDIGNTSQMYARTFFEHMSFDAITVAPYMGSDSVDPFLQYDDKWVILLALTSNRGALDFQTKVLQDSRRPLFEEVIRISSTWASEDRMMYVVGATKAAYVERVRAAAPHHFLLVPGVGAQGGDLQQVVEKGINKECGLLVNASRSIIYASEGLDFASAARKAATDMQRQMDALLQQTSIK